MTTPPEFTLEKDRYRLYAAMSCPFAHRVRLVRLLHGLEDAIKLTFVTGQSTESFTFDQPEPEFGAMTLREVYNNANPSHEGRATVPLMLDRTSKKIADNNSLESSISLATQCADDSFNLLPEGAKKLAYELDEKVSFSPYKFLFCPDHTKKGDIADALWSEFNKYDKLLETQPFIMGDKITFPDCILWATVIRFDNVYVRQFGVEGKTIKEDYPNLAKFAERLWNIPSKSGDTTLGEDANLPEIIRLYWQSRNLSSSAGNDPTSSVPKASPIF